MVFASPNDPLPAADLVQNDHACPPTRFPPAAPATADEAITVTSSPGKKGRAGRNSTAVLPERNANVPLTAPPQRPKTCSDDALTVAGLTGAVKFNVIVAAVEAPVEW